MKDKKRWRDFPYEDEDEFQSKNQKRRAGDDLWAKKVKPKHKVKKFKYKDL
jgi:hypothetical protein|tara:strand:+ start:166 stop:318 length:153 start_codon:yes stop_codon:yes gene_type:complete